MRCEKDNLESWEPIGEQKVCWEDAICLTPELLFYRWRRIGHGA